MRNTVIVGGGIAGLISAIQLARAGFPCTIIEKKTYPFHRVCGEYISNEAAPFLKSLHLYPDEFAPPRIDKFQLSAVSGRTVRIPLDLGGFGISRYAYDHFLYRQATAAGVNVLVNTQVQNIAFDGTKFLIEAGSAIVEADVVIGAFGKRSKLDLRLKRSFIEKRSPYAAIKYHIRTDHPADLIALHNFPGGYCGLSKVEDDVVNLCYLAHRDALRHFGDVKALEENALYVNPHLKEIFKNSDFLFAKPEVINEISFANKAPVEQHVLLVGDAAGMITPLCGNGMAMAIHASKLLAELIIQFLRGQISRAGLERHYAATWSGNFSRRMMMGRQIQRLFGNAFFSDLTVRLAVSSKPLANVIVRNTHGDIF